LLKKEFSRAPSVVPRGRSVRGLRMRVTSERNVRVMRRLTTRAWRGGCDPVLDVASEPQLYFLTLGQ
jgi:hypothetical protein